MSLLDQFQRWVKEPAPEYLFEVSERGLAFAQPRNPSTLRIAPMSEKALAVSPFESNVTRFDLFKSAFPKSAGNNGQRRTKAALVIPDYATRISVLDFDELPGDEQQRTALVRFRLRKSVPFSIDEAQISCSIQSTHAQNGKMEVLAAAIARTVLDEYEGMLRSLGFQVGLVLPSSLAALPLCSSTPGTLTLVAKLSGSILSILLVEDRQIRVIRCVDLSSEESSLDEQPEVTSTMLQQTLAFAEDELNHPVQRLLLCGFGAQSEQLGTSFQQEFGLSWAPLRSRFGIASQENAGLLGLMEQYIV